MCCTSTFRRGAVDDGGQALRPEKLRLVCPKSAASFVETANPFEIMLPAVVILLLLVALVATDGASAGEN